MIGRFSIVLWVLAIVLGLGLAAARAEIRNPVSGEVVIQQVEAGADFGTTDRQVLFNSGGVLTGDSGIVYNSKGLLDTTLDFTPTTKTADHIFALVDSGAYVRFSSSGALAGTIPPNGDVAFPIGTQLPFSMAGAGTLTIGPGSGVTISDFGGVTFQSAGGLAVKTGTNTWDLFGGQ